MRGSTLLSGSCVALLATFVACGSDDDPRSEAGAGRAGAETGGAGAASTGGASHGGSSAAGNAGRAAAAGAPPTPGGEGGGAGSSVDGGGEAGVAGAAGVTGAGGAPASCAEQPAPAVYSCAEIAQLAPTVDRDQSELSMEIPDLEFPIESGSVSFFYQTEDALSCGQTELLRGEGKRVFVNMQILFIPGTLRIWAFDLVDSCGGHHVFDPTGAACSELSGTVSSPTFLLSCSTAPGDTCPAQCI
jgi:hypothetical protein